MVLPVITKSIVLFFVFISLLRIYSEGISFSIKLLRLVLFKKLLTIVAADIKLGIVTKIVETMIIFFSFFCFTSDKVFLVGIFINFTTSKVESAMKNEFIKNK